MSEQVPERQGGGRKENIFTHKIGPLPMWVWLLIALAVLLGFTVLRGKKSSSGASSPTNTANASQVPQFVNQTYTTVFPPTAPGSVDHDSGGGPGRGAEVPNVVGLNDTAADTRLKTAGFNVKDSDEPKGGFGKRIGLYVVTSQSPSAGSRAPRGSTVTLTFGKKGAVNPGGPDKSGHGDNKTAVRAASTGVQPTGAGSPPPPVSATGIAGGDTSPSTPWVKPRI